MARKRHLFHDPIRFFLKKLDLSRAVLRTCLLFLSGLFFVLQLSPVFSQTAIDPVLSEIKNLQQQSQINYDRGHFFQAYQDLQKLIQL
jgi:hypothetical protein